ncbi:hypothetical protein Cgig2_009995 [Carnegiea gigantea]|uniref:AB hydrolase-1 domain-containing protein n=1 Tax=Carnegiea gigantea TaxID=171969 RepID=A0A9Q1JWW4_9CARY|nr:hypothetical protein Cgig2_009995 [Carnegiea gigantea]
MAVSFLLGPLSHVVAPPTAARLLPQTCGPSVRAHSLRFSLLLQKNRVALRVLRVIKASQLTQDELTMGSDCAVAQLRAQFIQVLRSRRSPDVPLRVEPAKPVANPMYQENPPPTFSEAMESCPKADIENLKDLLVEENLYLHTEASEQGRLPVLVLSLKESSRSKRPAIVFLHSTHKCKEWLRPLLEAYASRGYIAVAVDSRYHGERASSLTTYRDALVSSWKKGNTMPFIFDTVWDLIKLADYLTQQRDDIDFTRIGITGESLGGWLNKYWICLVMIASNFEHVLVMIVSNCGETNYWSSRTAGMHAWFAAFADTRYFVVAPIIGVQGFRWAIDSDKWQGRVDSIKAVFEVACADLGKSEIDKEVVEKVWDRIAPGLASQFDAPYSVPTIAPRPLLILNGADDPRCPLSGLDIPLSKAQKAYEEAGCSDNLKLVAEPGVGHRMTPSMVVQASDWFDRFLK